MARYEETMEEIIESKRRRAFLYPLTLAHKINIKRSELAGAFLFGFFLDKSIDINERIIRKISVNYKELKDVNKRFRLRTPFAKQRLILFQLRDLGLISISEDNKTFHIKIKLSALHKLLKEEVLFHKKMMEENQKLGEGIR